MKAPSKPGDGPVIITIAGEQGRGKTTFAATFPNPVFIRAEGGLDSIPESERPDAFDLITSVDNNNPDDANLWAQLSYLGNEDHDYKTVVIDSITQLNELFVEEILSQDAGKSWNTAHGGYGSTTRMLTAMHRRLRAACEVLAQVRDMNVVFIAHSDHQLFEPHDREPYMINTLKLDKKSKGAYVEDVQLVGFLQMKTLLSKKGETTKVKKAVSSGEIFLNCVMSVDTDAKNRYGITELLKVDKGENPLYSYIPRLNQTGE